MKCSKIPLRNIKQNKCTFFKNEIKKINFLLTLFDFYKCNFISFRILPKNFVNENNTNFSFKKRIYKLWSTDTPSKE